MRTSLALDALEMAVSARLRAGQSLTGLVHHSDRGGQYLAIRYTARLEQAGAITSVGSKGDSYDNALAETIIGLYKAELIRHRGPWHSVPMVEDTVKRGATRMPATPASMPERAYASEVTRSTSMPISRAAPAFCTTAKCALPCRVC